ncbi:hypothetical protein MHZ92_14515 [Sporosarcina sp. ACRSL]|uniref:hypothetical protein n=1 Tax=Sporosarcina sp. ACRSL TaxID=2918215 RepID=UPI001EF56ED2|nr:hypothetical protein [Sporosarcina sp. ACRSL]MCG7345349.1 hypothetical protein [Sporosarcina sp. ACRSL]
MAKLTGIKTVDMVNGEITKISHKGAEYVRVEGITQAGEIQAGDIGLVSNDYLGDDLLVKSFYKMRTKPKYDDKWLGVVSDELDEPNGLHYSKFVVFRKVAVETPQVSQPFAEMITAQIRDVGAQVEAVEKRVTALEDAQPSEKLTVGDRVRVSGLSLFGNDHDGELGTLERVDADGDHSVILDVGKQRYYRREQLSKVEDAKPAETIDFKGATYTLVERKAQPGDVVVFTENTSSCVDIGKPYGPVDVSRYSDDIVTEEGGYCVYHKGFDRTEANVLVYAPKELPLKVGDYVKPLPSADDEYSVTDRRMKLGKVVELPITGAIKVEIIAHEESRQIGKKFAVLAKHFVKATDAEVAEAMPKPKTGDIVVITANTNDSVNEVGDIGKVGDVHFNAHSVRVKVEGRSDVGNWTRYSEMRLATPTEVAQYEKAVAEADAKEKADAVFTKIGRKPNEFRKGDIVRAAWTIETEYSGGIFEIERGPVGATDGGNYYLKGDDITLGKFLTLIAPVESRVDTK